MDKVWRNIFENYPKKEELRKIISYVDEERKTKTIYPPKELVFKTFELNFYDVKVVILGQDPYHNEGEACGLSFSVSSGVKLPKSLINIYKELNSDLGVVPSKNGDLSSWLKQGVFLLNSVLTVEKNSPASHSKLGWQDFTDYIIKEISNKREGVVFILWGRYACQKKYLIDETRHKIIESPHPSPFSAHKGFFGSRPFSKTNEYLLANKKKEIDWRIK